MAETSKIHLSRLWVMNWETREVRAYEDGKTLRMQPVTREVEGGNPLRKTTEHFTYAVLHGLPPLPRAWFSVAIFGQDYAVPRRPWFAVPKLDLNIEPKEWRTVGSKLDGSHLYYGVDGPPDAALIPMADQWKENNDG